MKLTILFNTKSFELRSLNKQRLHIFLISGGSFLALSIGISDDSFHIRLKHAFIHFLDSKIRWIFVGSCSCLHLLNESVDGKMKDEGWVIERVWQQTGEKVVFE